MPRVSLRRLAVIASLLTLTALPATAGASLNRWQLISTLDGTDVNTVVTVPGNPGDLYVADTFHVFHSLDNGQTWAAQTSPCLTVSLAVDPSSPDTVYAGCMSAQVFKSTDGGGTWTATGAIESGSVDAGRIWGLAVDPSDGTVYAVGDGAGSGHDVWRSTDGGASWMAVHDGPFELAVSIDPNTPGHVVVSGNELTVSTDGGDTWSAPAPDWSPQRVVFDPADPTVLWAIHDSSPTSGVARSTDGGTTWTDLPASPTGLRTILFHGGAVWVAGDDGVGRSTDGGDTWAASGLTNGDGTPAALAIDPSDPGHVFVGMANLGSLWDVHLDAALQPVDAFQGFAIAPVTDLTPTSATLNATIAGVPADATGFALLHYGVTDPSEHTVVENAITFQPTEQVVSAPVTGLTPGTTYQVTVEGALQVGSLQFSGYGPAPTQLTFTTPTPPSVSSLPVPHLTPGQLTAAGQLPITVQWQAAPGTYPVARSDVQELTNGGPWVTVTPTGTAAFASTATFDGSTYRLRARAVDSHGFAGAWSPGPRFAARLVDDPDSTIRWGAGWTRTWSGSAAGGTLHTTAAAGAHVTLSFTGRSIAVIGPRGPHLARLTATLDGAPRAAVDPFAQWGTARRTLAIWSWPTAGPHTVTLTALTTAARPRAALDAFAVLD